MADKHSDVASVTSSQAQATLPSTAAAAASVAVLDRKTVQALFAALRTSIPAEVQHALLRDSLEEVKFLIARQPRLSSFHHRRRESLRHPALAMATKNYYQLCRRKRIELAVQAVAAEQQQQQQQQQGQPGRPHSKRGEGVDGVADNADVIAAQREAELVDMLLAEYAKSGGFQDDYGYFNNHHGTNNNNVNSMLNTNASLGESIRSNGSVSFGSRGAGGTNAQLMSSISAMELRSEASLSMGESRNGAGTFFTEVGGSGANALGMSGVWRGGPSILHHGSSSNNNNNNTNLNNTSLADSMGMIAPGRLGQSFGGGNNNNVSVGDGVIGGHARGGKSTRVSPGGAGRFFSKRHDRAEGVGSAGRGRGGRGDGLARWGAEMHAMVIRRAEEELRAGSGGDPYLLTSSRPIEVLLTCYGGVQRESAVMAMGAASLLMGVDNFAASTSTTTPADADPLFNAVVEEDVRWDQLAQCYRQLLREANTVRQAAATAVAHDPLVNDVIRRFWDRLTVSAAAQQAHKAQEVNRKRDAAADAAAFSKRVHSRLIAGEADEDDLDEIQNTNEDDGDAFGVGGGLGARAGARGGLRGGKDASDAGSRKGNKGGGNKGKKKKKAAVAGFSANAAEPASTVAYYMTPLQYVYLHTRLAHVLLPESNALDMEMLYFIQEDLLVDAAYSESDAAQTLYFGEAPRLVSTSAAGSAAGVVTVGGTRARNAERRQGGKGRFALWPEDDSASGDEDGPRGPSLRQRFLAVRRHGYALGEDGGVSNRQDDNVSVLVRHPTAHNIGAAASDDGSSSHRGGNNNFGSGGGGNGLGVNAALMGGLGGGGGGGGEDGDSKQVAMNALPLVNMCFSISELPSLTYQQFWCSMMELADNWTCCAGHPVETAIFLWELYAEVFGHNWGAEDEALATALEEKAATVSKTERVKIDEEVAEALRSFHDLVKALRAREKESRPSSSSGLSGGLNVPLSENVTFLPGGGTKQRRRRRGSRKSTSQPIVELEKTNAWDSSSSSDSDLSLTEWNALAVDRNRVSGEWVYLERVGEDGVKRRFRRRVVHRQPRRRKDVDHARQRNHNTSSQDDFEDDDDDNGELSFILEEELGEDGAVVKQRKRRCKAVVEEAQQQRRRRAKQRANKHSSITGDALYERRRKYDEDNAKRLRRLEPRRRVEGGSSHGSSLTSWDSYDDGTPDERRNGRRRRPRIRRTGPRHHRLLPRAMVDGGENAVGAAAANKAGAKSSLTPEELQELQANKEWLCTVLGAKGISLPSHMFDDPAEQVLLYELLRLTKESEARGGGGLGGDGGGGGDGFFNVGDGEGSGGTDLSRLAALLAQSAAFNLDGLDDSALMRRLLGEGGGGASQFLSPHQLQSILLALAKGQKPGQGQEGATSVTETEGMRARRLRLLRMLEERQAREQQEQSKEDANETTLPPSTAADNNNNNAGGAASVEAGPPPSESPPFPISRPASVHSLTPPSVNGDGLNATSGDAAGAAEVSVHRIPTPPPPLKPTKPSKETEEAVWVLSPSTAAERREQERLFRELEAYWTNRASQRGRYRVHIIEYTTEQLEEFFAHLHLGSRQRALLRGRAPLAAATSLVGGTLHQTSSPDGTPRTSDAHASATSSAAAAPSRSPPAPVVAAPVKLFTLTTERSLDGALQESYQSYLSDKAFSRAFKTGAYRAQPPVPPAQQQQPPPPHPNLPSLSQISRTRGKSSPLGVQSSASTRASVVGAVAGSAAAASAAPPSPTPSSKRLPSVAGPTTRRTPPPSSATSVNSLPKV